MSRPVRNSLAFLSIGRLVLNTAYRFVYPFLPIIARGLGVPLEQAALLISVRHLAGLATPGANRTLGAGERRRRLIVIALALFITGCAVTAATSVYVGALAGFALLGLSKPLFDVASQAYISDRVPYERRARSLATFEFSWSLALLIGVPLTGWLIARTCWATPFWVFALVTAGALLLVPAFIDADGHISEGSTTDRTPFGPSALAFLAVVGLVSMAAETVFVVFGAWLESSYAATVAVLSGASFLIATAEFVGEGATFGFTDRIGKRRAVLGGIVLSTTGFVMLALWAPTMVIGLGLMALAILGFEFTYVSSVPLASELAPGARARYLAWMVVTIGIGRGIGAAVGPVLFRSFDVAGPAFFAAAVDLAAVGLIATLVREADAASNMVGTGRDR